MEWLLLPVINLLLCPLWSLEINPPVNLRHNRSVLVAEGPTFLSFRLQPRLQERSHKSFLMVNCWHTLTENMKHPLTSRVIYYCPLQNGTKSIGYYLT